MDETFTIYKGDQVIAENVSVVVAMDYVWSEINTYEPAIRIINSKGQEVEW